ncbi:MAG: hypothetical protein Q8J69_01015, partial [Sphingobacteriaceae bacterium]|nr:hypothetical protein [Sphingobacteriaceae bacterium]
TAITLQPSAPASLCIGSSLNLQATAVGHQLSYQWTRNGSPISGATQPTLNIASLTAADAGSYRLIVNGSCGNDTSVAVVVQPLALTSIVSQPQNATSCLGSATTFRITALGAGLSYTWLVNGTAQNVNADSLVFNPTTVGTFNIRAIVTGSCGTDTSSMAVLEVRPVTAITQQPSAPASLCIGSALNLQATAVGHNLSYQWTRNGNPISGATQPGLNFTSLTAADAGSYRLIATGSCGSDTSIAVLVQPLALTSITAQPQSATSCLGNATTFRITALGAGLSYTWLVNGTAQSVNADSLVFNPAAIGTFNIRAIVTGSCGTDTSSIAVLEVRPVTAITLQPSAPASLCIGSALNLQATAVGHQLSYQWTRNGSLISGATQPTLNIASLTAADAGSYRLIVNGSCGNDTSVAVLVQPLALTSITAQPIAPTSFCIGSPLSLQVTALGAQLTYQWTFNGNPVAGATQPILNFASLSAANAGTYRVIVTGSCGSDTSVAIMVQPIAVTTITQQPTAPSIVCDGSPVSLQAVASGQQLSYQWIQNGIAIPGATQATLNISSFTTLNAGIYRLIVNGSCGSDTSVALNIQPTLNTGIIAGPQNATSCLGNATTFRLQVQGASLFYSWTVNGVPQNVNADSLVLNPVSPGVYQIQASINGLCGSFTSGIALLEVRAATAITQQPIAPGTICIGSPLNLQATATGHNLSYQWTRNGSPISGATQPSFSISGLSAADAGSYRLIATGSCGSDSSVAILVQPLSLTSITTQPQNANACLGNPTTFRLTAQGAGLSYTWLVNGLAQGTNADSLVLNPSASGIYNIRAIVTGSCGNDTSTLVTLSLTANSSNTIAATICASDVYNFFGQSLNIAGSYQATIPNSQGCDSLITLQLTVNPNPLPLVVNNAGTLSTDAFVRYQWFLDGIALPGDTLRNLQPTQNGQYQVQVVDSFGCTGRSDSVAVIGLSIQEQRANNLRLYPVPAKSSVFVIVDMNKPQTHARLRSSTGQLIRTVLLEAGQNELIIDDLADGVYYLECEGQVRRFIRQH